MSLEVVLHNFFTSNEMQILVARLNEMDKKLAEARRLIYDVESAIGLTRGNFEYALREEKR